MDSLSRKRWKDRFFVDNPLYRSFSGALARIYRDQQAIGKIIFPLIRLRTRVGIRTRFVKVESRGEVTVTYGISGGLMAVHADFTKLNKRGCKNLLLLNEQCATFFSRLTG